MVRNTELRVVLISVSAMVIAAGLNMLIDAGAVLHDLFCSTHGILG